MSATALLAFAVFGGAQSANVNASENNNGGAAVQFDTTFLRTDPKRTVDVSRFSRGNLVSPGIYSVDIWVNETRVSREDVRFVAARDGESATPCFTNKMLQRFGVDFAKVGADTGAKAPAAGTVQAEIRPGLAVSTDAKAVPTSGECIDLAATVPGATTEFDFSEQKLTLSVRQKYMRNSARGYVPLQRGERHFFSERGLDVARCRLYSQGHVERACCAREAASPRRLYPPTGGTYPINLAIQYYRTGALVSGTVKGALTYTITYQ
jgi:outer membrane usher protein FimD/PapC